MVTCNFAAGDYACNYNTCATDMFVPIAPHNNYAGTKIYCNLTAISSSKIQFSEFKSCRRNHDILMTNNLCCF